jgi:hypothetical protein
LAEKHRNKLRPTGKTLGGVFGAVLLNQRGELGPRKVLEQLIEQAGSLYDCLGPPCGRRSAKLPARKDSPTFNYRRALYPRSSKPVLDKSDPLLQIADLISGMVQEVLLLAHSALGFLDNGLMLSNIANFRRYYSHDSRSATLFAEPPTRYCFVANQGTLTNLDSRMVDAVSRNPKMLLNRIEKPRKADRDRLVWPTKGRIPKP